MNTKHFFWSFGAVLGLAATTFFLPTTSTNGQPTLQPPQLSPPPTSGPIPAGMEDQQGQAGAQDGMEMMARGPVHEAFAEPAEAIVKNTLVSPKQPPQPIEEIPPDVKPEGNNVVWIPGYWIWDDDRNDFIWVSGVWRAVPAGRKWIPGYWGQNENGFVRTPGFWAEERVDQVQYLPQPPDSLENGPTSDSPGIDYYWVPGCYEWRTRYAWRPGYWARVNPNWIWCPAHYVFTPYGYVFVAGYWDYPVALRGVLFAPIYFSEPVYLRPRWYYSPWVSIDVGVLNVSFFSRPSYCHYYFGDYYDNRFVTAGFYPFFAVQTYHHGWYDPIYNHRRCLYSKSDPNWTRKLETQHEFFVKNVDQRPPKTFKEQAILAQKLKDTGKGERDNNVIFARNYKDFAANDKSMKFQTLQPDAREKFTEQANNYRKFSQERGELETKGGGKFATDKGLVGPGGSGENKDGVKTLDFKGKGVVGLGGQGSGGGGKFDGTPGTGRSRSDRGLNAVDNNPGDGNKTGNQGLGGVNKGGDNKGLGDGNNPAFRKGGVGQDNIGGTGGSGTSGNFNKDKVSDGLKLNDGPKVGDGQKTGDGSKVDGSNPTFRNRNLVVPDGGQGPKLGGSGTGGGGSQSKGSGGDGGQPTFKRGGNPGGSGNSNPGGSGNPGSGGRNSGGNKDGNKGKDDDNKGKMSLRDVDGDGGAGTGIGGGQKVGDGNPAARTFSNPSLGGNQSYSGGSNAGGGPKLSNDDLNKIRARSFSGNNQGDNGPSMRTFKPPDNSNDGPKLGGGGGPTNMGGQKFMKAPDNSGGGGNGPPAQFRSGGGSGNPKKINVPPPNPDQGKDSDKDNKDKRPRR